MLGQADKVFAIGNRRSGWLLAVAVDVHQVHVRAVVQLVASQFAQGEDGKRRVHPPAQGVEVLRRAVAPLQFTVRLAQGLLDQHIGQSRDFRRRLSQGRDFQNIAQHDADILAPLEACQGERNIVVQRARPKASQALVKFFLGKAAVKIFLSQKRRQQVGILDQCLAQKPAVAENHNGVVRQKMMLFQQAHNFGRLAQALKQKQGAIRIRGLRQQPRQGRGQYRRKPRANALQATFGQVRIAKPTARVGAGL